MDHFPDSPAFYLVSLAILLAFSMFFSASESAFSSANRLHIRYLSEKKHRAARRVEAILAHKELFLNTVLVGNNVVNIATSALITSVSLRLFGDAGVGLATAFATIIILIFGEILPKSVALHWPERLALRFSLPIRIIVTCASPAVILLTILTRALARLAGEAEQSVSRGLTEDDLKTLIEVGEEEGVIESGKKSMLHRILSYADLTARDVMTPRTAIVGIPESASREEAIAIHARERYSRYPLYRDNIDTVVGMLRIRDLVLDDEAETGDWNGLRDYALKPVFAYASQPLASVQTLLRDENRNMAIVIDEYGGTAGIVTTEDLAEAVFGGLRDEFDDESADDAETGVLTIDGTERLAALSERLGIHLESQRSETIAGLILERLGDIPHIGMSIIEGGCMFTVAEREGNRIASVRVDHVPGAVS